MWTKIPIKSVREGQKTWETCEGGYYFPLLYYSKEVIPYNNLRHKEC
jgi:hypothetical protein